MKARLKTMRWAGLCLLATGTMVACVDDEYDLSKDIDMTVTVGGANLVIPASSTEPITLKKIFDLGDDEDQALKTAKAGNEFGLQEGDYYLHEKGSESLSSITVDAVTMDLGVTYEQDVELNVDLSANLPAGLPEDLSWKLPENEKFELSIGENDLYSQYVLHQDKVTGQLRKLDWLKFKEARMTLHLFFNDNSMAKTLHIQKGFSIEFPSYIKVNTTSDGWDVVGDNIVKATKEIVCISGASGGVVLDVNIEKADFKNTNPLIPGTKNDDGTYNDDGQFNTELRIEAHGEMFLYGRDVKELTGKDKEININMHINAKMGTATLSEVNGQMALNNIEIEPVNFVDIPDFLNDPETNIDLSDPRIFLTITNGAPVEMTLGAVLKPLDENGQPMKKNGKDVVIAIGKENGTAELKIDESQTTILELSRTGSSTRTGSKGIKIDNLSDLVARVPAMIKVEDVWPVVEGNVELDKTYDVNTEYEIVAPLAFGEDLNFVYRDTLNGWQEDLDGFELSCVEVELTAHNQIPMQLTLDAVPLDVDGNELDDVKVEVTGNIPASDGTKVEENTLKLTLIATGGTIRNLDGLQLLVVGKSTSESAGKAINENQTLQLTGVKLRVKDGITLDLN